jgi:small acid-soluble spore protein P (minor)
MSKPDNYPVPGAGMERDSRQREGNPPQEPMHGSKKVKQANHSRGNHGEGS